MRKGCDREKKKNTIQHRGLSLTTCNEGPPAKSKMAARGPPNGRRSLERGPTLGNWPLSLYKFFDPSAPSMIKVDDGEKKTKKNKKRKEW